MNSPKFVCPECETDLVLSTDQLKYETANDHICDPDGEVPLRNYFACENKSCRLRSHAFWDFDGAFYSNYSKDGIDWYNNNCVDSFRRETWKRKGATALNSFSRDFDNDCIREKSGFRGLRRCYSPFGSFKSRFLYSLEILFLSPTACNSNYQAIY